LLAFYADFVEQDVPRIAQQLVVVQLVVSVSGLRSTAVLLTSTGLPFRRFRAWTSWKSSALPNSGGGLTGAAARLAT